MPYFKKKNKTNKQIKDKQTNKEPEGEKKKKKSL
jgi:hypothetical protein